MAIWQFYALRQAKRGNSLRWHGNTVCRLPAVQDANLPAGTYVLARSDDPDTVHRPNELLPDTKAELALPMRRAAI